VTDPITIQRLLVQFDASDVTQRDFARQVEVPYSTFTSWLALAETHPSLSTQDLTLLLDGVEFKDTRKKPWHRG
jgi:hypothetical protein